MNRIVLVGRLARDVEKRTIEETGKVSAKIILAVNRPFKNSNGERQVDFIPIIMWGKKAEVISEYATKGNMISVTGRLQVRKYSDQEGNFHYRTEVVADEFQFLGSKKPEENIG